MTAEYFTASQDSTDEYQDKKRLFWLLGVFYPLIPFTGIGLHAWTGNPLSLALPLFLIYGLGTLLDIALGKDSSNPPETVVPQLEEDRYYRILTYLVVPMHFIALIGSAWWASTQAMPWWGWLLIAVTAGVISGLGVNTGHELGHKKTRLEKNLAKLVLAVPAYGHFCVEHNRGHHKQVATPEDPASSRMGENIYRFGLREIPGAFKRAWVSEKQRLRKQGKHFWSHHNVLLQSYSLSLVLQVSLVVVFGWAMLLFLLIHNVLAWWQLTSANYIEHYGLLRKKLESGKYERCQLWHSWNANQLYSNLLLFHLERHSDHHTNPARRYQALRHDDDLPQLPGGYFAMFLLAYVPPLWFRVMNPLLLQLPHIQGDLDQVNIDPRHRDRILREYATGL